MGQAFDRDGHALGEAYGNTKREVFDKLQAAHPEAHEIRIKTLEADTQRHYIDKRFAYHKPSEEGLFKINNLREQYSVLKGLLEKTCPPSRQLSLALTELETSAMWAIKAVVFNDPKSDVDQGESITA